MILNCSYFASTVSLVYLSNVLTWNKMADPGSNSLNLHELGGKKVNLRKYLTRSIFVSDLSLLNLHIVGAYNLKNR